MALSLPRLQPTTLHLRPQFPLQKKKLVFVGIAMDQNRMRTNHFKEKEQPEKENEVLF